MNINSLLAEIDSDRAPTRTKLSEENLCVHRNLEGVAKKSFNVAEDKKMWRRRWSWKQDLTSGETWEGPTADPKRANICPETLTRHVLDTKNFFKKIFLKPNTTKHNEPNWRETCVRKAGKTWNYDSICSFSSFYRILSKKSKLFVFFRMPIFFRCQHESSPNSILQDQGFLANFRGLG